jgi:hypothetical protein
MWGFASISVRVGAQVLKITVLPLVFRGICRSDCVSMCKSFVIKGVSIIDIDLVVTQLVWIQ